MEDSARITGSRQEEAERLADFLKESEKDDRPRPRTEAQKARINANAAWIKGVLMHHAQTVASNADVDGLHPDDAEELNAAVDKQLAALPSRFRVQAKETARQITRYVSEGSRQPAWTLAREVAISMGAELPKAFSPPVDDSSDLDEILDNIQRG